jgi:hypothetical protein
LGDWTFGKGLSNYAKDNDAINLNIKTRILSWVGDCFFALNEGVDWVSRLDAGQQDALKQEIETIIQQSYGVVEVTSSTVTFDGTIRNFRGTYNIKTIFSPSFISTFSLAVGG